MDLCPFPGLGPWEQRYLPGGKQARCASSSEMPPPCVPTEGRGIHPARPGHPGDGAVHPGDVPRRREGLQHLPRPAHPGTRGQAGGTLQDSLRAQAQNLPDGQTMGVSSEASDDKCMGACLSPLVVLFCPRLFFFPPEPLSEVFCGAHIILAVARHTSFLSQLHIPVGCLPLRTLYGFRAEQLDQCWMILFLSFCLRFFFFLM